MAVVNVLY